MISQCPNEFPTTSAAYRIALCGESPGEREQALRRPFVGAAGAHLDRMLAGAGILRSACFVGNVCVDAGTPVLMSDLTWRAICDIRVGDKVLAFDEEGRTRGKLLRKWRIATVTATSASLRECLRVTTPHGDIILTPDHKVLRAYRNQNQCNNWTHAGRLQIERSHLSFLFPPELASKHLYEKAYLAGLFDGEGCLTVNSAPKGKRSLMISFSQNPNCVLEEGVRCMKELGFEVGVIDNYASKYRAQVARIKGGVRATLHFLSLVRSKRLLLRLAELLQDPPVFRVTPAIVYSKERVGLRSVVDITTTTGTFIANGFAVHNCQIRPPGNDFNTLEWGSAEVQDGIEALLADLTAFAPNLVVTLGNVPLHLFRKGNVNTPRHKRGGKLAYDWPSKVTTWRGSLFLSSPRVWETLARRLAPSPEVVAACLGKPIENPASAPQAPVAAGASPALAATVAAVETAAVRGENAAPEPDLGPVPPSARPQWKCLSTLHPAYCLRAWSENFNLRQDLRRARAEGESPALVLPELDFAYGP